MSSTPEVGLSEEDQRKIKAAAISGDPDDLLPDGESTTPVRAPIRDGDEPMEKYPDANESTATREKALNGGEYERLLIGASRLGGERGLETWAAIVILGRLRVCDIDSLHSVWWMDTADQAFERESKIATIMQNERPELYVHSR